MATDERPCEERLSERVEPRVPLLVGSDCSGMCTESHALDALGIAHAHAFSSEVWEPAIRCVRAMGSKRPKLVYRDVTERTPTAAAARATSCSSMPSSNSASSASAVHERAS